MPISIDLLSRIAAAEENQSADEKIKLAPLEKAISSSPYYSKLKQLESGIGAELQKGDVSTVLKLIIKKKDTSPYDTLVSEITKKTLIEFDHAVHESRFDVEDQKKVVRIIREFSATLNRLLEQEMQENHSEKMKNLRDLEVKIEQRKNQILAIAKQLALSEDARDNLMGILLRVTQDQFDQFKQNINDDEEDAAKINRYLKLFDDVDNCQAVVNVFSQEEISLGDLAKLDNLLAKKIKADKKAQKEEKNEQKRVAEEQRAAAVRLAIAADAKGFFQTLRDDKTCDNKAIAGFFAEELKRTISPDIFVPITQQEHVALHNGFMKLIDAFVEKNHKAPSQDQEMKNLYFMVQLVIQSKKIYQKHGGNFLFAAKNKNSFFDEVKNAVIQLMSQYPDKIPSISGVIQQVAQVVSMLCVNKKEQLGTELACSLFSILEGKIKTLYDPVRVAAEARSSSAGIVVATSAAGLAKSSAPTLVRQGSLRDGRSFAEVAGSAAAAAGAKTASAGSALAKHNDSKATAAAEAKTKTQAALMEKLRENLRKSQPQVLSSSSSRSSAAPTLERGASSGTRWRHERQASSQQQNQNSFSAAAAAAAAPPKQQRR